MIFGEKLQQLRKKSGMSQEQLAAQITVSRQAVSKWELGESMPDTDNVLQISELFGVSVDYLLKNKIEEFAEDAAHTNFKEAYLKRYTLISLGVVIAGLLTAVVGWKMWMTIIPVGVGLLIQLAGVVLFESTVVSKLAKKQIPQTRKRYYSIAAWGLLPVPVYIAVNSFFGLYPRPYNSFLPLVAAAGVYIILSVVVTLVLKREKP